MTFWQFASLHPVTVAVFYIMCVLGLAWMWMFAVLAISRRAGVRVVPMNRQQRRGLKHR